MNKKGQALVEYILIVALISVIAIALVNYFGGYLKDTITKTSCAMLGEKYVKGEKPGEGICSSEDVTNHWLVFFKKYWIIIIDVLKLIIGEEINKWRNQ